MVQKVTTFDDTREIFIGLSTDAKPNTAVVTSEFYAYDTGILYIKTVMATNTWSVKKTGAVNANLQVGSADNSLSNPVFAEIVGIDISKARTLDDAASMVVKATPGTLFSLTGSSSSATDLYLQLFDSATLPIDTTVPIHTILIPAGEDFNFDFTPPYGLFFSTGMVWCTSTTRKTKTLGTASFWVVAQYI